MVSHFYVRFQVQETANTYHESLSKSRSTYLRVYCEPIVSVHFEHAVSSK